MEFFFSIGAKVLMFGAAPTPAPTIFAIHIHCIFPKKSNLIIVLNTLFSEKLVPVQCMQTTGYLHKIP
jgi:hypothetical protein